VIAVDHPKWMQDAACHGIGDEFYPEGAHSSTVAAQIRQAKDICNLYCTVREACLDYALANRERHGVWGGKSEDERAAMVEIIDLAEGRIDIDRVKIERAVDALCKDLPDARLDWRYGLNSIERRIAVRVLVHDKRWTRTNIGNTLRLNNNSARRYYEAALEAGAVNLEKECAA
jgi:WhiB family redox-sensing transcriptional regulator